MKLTTNCTNIINSVQIVHRKNKKRVIKIVKAETLYNS